MARAAVLDGTAAFVTGAYDAAALSMPAMQTAGSIDPPVCNGKVIAADARGKTVLPGRTARCRAPLAAGRDVDYPGASAVGPIGPGESAGT